MPRHHLLDDRPPAQPARPHLLDGQQPHAGVVQDLERLAEQCVVPHQRVADVLHHPLLLQTPASAVAWASISPLSSWARFSGRGWVGGGVLFKPGESGDLRGEFVSCEFIFKSGS